jgi:hypothetical protein
MSFITYVYSALNPFKWLQKWNIDVSIVACGRLAEDSLSTASVIALNAIMVFVITVVALLATYYEGRCFTLR